WAVAREHGVQLRFEAAVAGVVPVIRVLQESLAGAPVQRIHGIVNGTTNFILTEMARTGADFASTLKQAQDLGYAEADPTEDVNGKDAAAKMAILARLAFDTPLHLEVADKAGVLGQVAQVLGLQDVSIKSVVQKGLGKNARLVMVVHPVGESRFYAALELLKGLGALRSPPRAIRVIEEEFN